MLYVRIDLAQLDWGIRSYLVNLFGSFLEECVVEIDDDLMAAIVDVERLWLDVEALQFLFVLDVEENLPVAVSPTIDALLDVSNQQALSS